MVSVRFVHYSTETRPLLSGETVLLYFHVCGIHPLVSVAGLKIDIQEEVPYSGEIARTVVQAFLGQSYGFCDALLSLEFPKGVR